MHATIVGFRGTKRNMYNEYCVIHIDDKNPARFIGRKVIFRTPANRTIKGKIIRQHGKDLLAKFDRGLPGFALGSKVEVK